MSKQRSGFGFIRPALPVVGVSALMHHGNDIHSVSLLPIDNRMGEPLHVMPSESLINEVAALRVFANVLQALPDGSQKLKGHSVTSLGENQSPALNLVLDLRMLFQPFHEGAPQFPQSPRKHPGTSPSRRRSRPIGDPASISLHPTDRPRAQCFRPIDQPTRCDLAQRASELGAKVTRLSLS